MPEIMRNFGFNHEGLALFFGVIALLTATLFFLQRFEIFTLNIIENFSDAQYLMFFASITFISGIIHLLTTLGFMGSN